MQRSTAHNALHIFLRLITVGLQWLETLLVAPAAMRAALHTPGEAQHEILALPDYQMSLLSLLGTGKP